MKQTIALFFASLLILGCLAACGGKDDPNKPAAQTSGTAVTTEAAATTEPEILPEIPNDTNYSGYEFKIISTDEIGSVRDSFEIYAEQDGEVMHDAVFARNLAVEEKLNAKIKQIYGAKASNGWVKDFQSSVIAGDDSIDILVATERLILSNAATYGAEASQLPYVDLDKPWWEERVIKGAAVAGKTYGLTGDLNLVDDSATWSVLFNKRIAKDNSLPDMYQLVRDHKWTLDQFDALCSGVSADLNGDSVRDYQDRWGFVCSGNVAISFLWSCGGSFSTLNKDGTVSITLDTPKNMEILNKLYDIFAKRDHVVTADRVFGYSGKTDWTVQSKIFTEGRALFYGAMINGVTERREMEDDFGILPCPMYNENQKDYICTAQEWCATMWMAPRTGGDLKRTSAILEYTAYASRSTIVPAYYDIVLTTKSARDEESAEMLDIIFSSRTFDVAYAFGWTGISQIPTAIVADSNTMASTIASIKDGVQKAADDTYKAFMENAK